MKYLVTWASQRSRFDRSDLFSQFKYVFVFIVLFIVLSTLALSQNAVANQTGTAAGTIVDTPTVDLASVLFSSELPDPTGQAKEYVSPEYKTDFQFNGVGLTWSGNAAADVSFYVSVNDGEWMIAPMLEHESKDQAEPFVSYPLFAAGNRVRYKIVGTDIQYVRIVRIIYFDSTPLPDSPSPFELIRSKLKQARDTASTRQTAETTPLAQQNQKIISRSEWGADENLRFWDPEYAAPEFFLLHHTAGSDGGENPAATIRGIYYWHTVVLGWGDIGYNYLIDRQGNVYEGRYGGAGVIGAHAYNSDTNTNYNKFSIGIAILGCFEEAEGACDSPNTLSPEVQSSLVNLMARKAKLNQIDPQGTNMAFDYELNNIVGHRDVDQTYCPGSVIHDNLALIRSQVAAALADLAQPAQPKFQAQPTSGELTATYQTTETPQLSFTYRNTGLYAWDPAKVEMRLMVRGTKKRQIVPLAEPVRKRADAQFNFTWTELPFHTDTYVVTTKLYHASRVIKKSSQRYTVNITNPYQAKYVKDTVPIAILQDWSPVVKFTFENSGESVWPAETQLVMNNEIVGQLTRPVAPGQTASLRARLNPQYTWERGEKNIHVYLQVGATRVEGSRLIKKIRID